MLKKAAALFLACVGIALCASCGKSSNHYVYASIPTASQIVAYREDPNSGALTPLSVSPITAGSGITSIAIHPSKQFLYAANSSLDSISLFTIAPGGALTEVTPRTPAGITPAFLVMDSTGSYLYVGNAASNNISAFSISSSSGALTPVGTPTQLGISPLNMVLSSSGNLLFVTGAGSPGWIEVFSLNAGALSLVQVARTGTNPYGLAVDPSGTHLYAANFGDNSISEFTINPGSTPVLTELSGSPFGEAYTSPVALLVDNSGKYLYVANEGSGNLGAYAIGSDGGLTLLTSSPFTTNAQPSVIANDPKGPYVFVGNQKGSAIQVFSLSPGSGSLALIGSYPVGNTPTSIAVLP